LVKWIPALTKPGEVIADPFTCTGTIALACKMTGRRFVGTEVDPDRVAVARKRLAACSAGQDAQAG
jgi:DNA modification methylase